MTNREIPREEWPKYFEGLVKRRRDAHATVRVLGGGIGAQVQAEALPFAGIDFDPKGGGTIEILLGKDPGRNLEHDVPAPGRVLAELADDGNETEVEIESGDGTRTIVEFSL